MALSLVCASWGCSGAAVEVETSRLRAICDLAEVDGRLDLLPAGESTVGARLVTLDRDGALRAVQAVDGGESSGIAMVRIEAPRPMIALVLRLDPGVMRQPPSIRHLINVAMTTENAEVETWIQSSGGSILYLNASNGDGLPPALSPGMGIDLRKANDLDQALLRGLTMAEGAGAAWIFGTLNRRTIEALYRFMDRHGESIHLVAIERVTEPPTAPQWLRRCSD